MPHQSPVKCQTDGARQSLWQRRFRPVGQQLKAVSLSVLSASTDWCREVTGGSVGSDLPGDGDLLICTIPSSSPGSADEVPLSLLVYFLLTDAHPTPRPHTHSRQTFHSLSSRGVHAPRTSPLLSVQRRRRAKHCFSTDEAPVCHILLHPVAVSLSLFSCWPQLTQTTAGLRHNSVQRKIILYAVTESMSRVVFGKKKPSDKRQREPLMLSCTALCFVLYQACKNYNQASTAFCALESRVKHHLSMTKLKWSMKRTKNAFLCFEAYRTGACWSLVFNVQ